MKRWNGEMIAALEAGDSESVLRMLNSGFPHCYPLRRKNESGSVVLSRTYCAHMAAECGSVEILQALADNSGDFELKDSLGRTPLLVAAQAGQLPAFLHLVTRRGAVLNARDIDGNTALHLAAVAGHIPVVQHLTETLHFPHNVKNNNGQTALALCSELEERGTVEEQLRLGPVVNYLTSVKQAGGIAKADLALFSPAKETSYSPSVHKHCKDSFRQSEWARDQGLTVLDSVRRGSSLNRKVMFQLVARDSLGPLPQRHASPCAVDRVIKERCDQIYDRFVNSRLVYLSQQPDRKQSTNRSTAGSELSRYSLKARTVT